MKKNISKNLAAILIFTGLGVARYFIKVEAQSRFERQALAKAALENHSLDEALKKAAAEKIRLD